MSYDTAKHQEGDMVVGERTDQEASVGREALLLSVEDVARALSIGLTNVRAIVASGEMMSVRIGRRVLIPRAEIEAYVQRLTERAEAGFAGEE